MSVSAYGGALTEANFNLLGSYTPNVEAPNSPAPQLSSDENLYKMALPILLSGNCRLDYLNDYGVCGEHSAFFEIVPPYFQEAKTEDGFDAGELAAMMMYEDFGSADCPSYLIDYSNPRTIGWSIALTRILRMAPIVIDECFANHGIFSLPSNMELSKTRLAIQIIRETCKWLIEHKEIPRIRNSTQAIVYLLSSCPCHSKIGTYWFARNPSCVSPRHTWTTRHPGLAYFFNAQSFNEETCALRAACNP
jgi:hypothetical protein